MEDKGVKHGLEQNGVNKRMKTDEDSKINVNESYVKTDYIKQLSESFCNKEEYSFENGSKIISEPFTCCILPDFIKPNDFSEQLKKDVEEIEVELKLSDLYQFKQSKDLATCKLSTISQFRKLLQGKFLDWMKEVTNIPLSDKIDMFCSCYTYTDHLLCHDDELEGRRIAYIYYLVPDWDEKFGGTLDLFNTIEDEPSEIVTSFVPQWNSLIFFEVSPVSYHQVAEIVAFKDRTSISGWFYGPPLKPANHPIEKMLFKPPTTVPIDIKQWINPTYLQEGTQAYIRQSFEESSEIELMDFFQAEKYEEVSNALLSNSLEWKLKGPCCRRKFEEIDNMEEIPVILKECQALFCSEPFLVILSNLTGLRLHPVCSEDAVVMSDISSSMRKWGPGSYTLLHDQSFFEYATLNAGLCFNCSDWEVEYGGYTSYVAKDEKEELLRVDPKPNSLAIVYITEGTSSFVKYINCRATEHSSPFFQDIFSVYRERE